MSKPLHPKRHLFGSIALAALACTGHPIAHAFGADGHRIVGEIAERQLTPTALEQVERLLAGEPQTSLAGISFWADEVREHEEYRWSAPLHYVNFPHGECRYRPRRDCPDARCVVAAIERYARELGDTSLPVAARRDALKWLVHFVADVHQPLHTGYADDRGGTRFQVFYAGRSSNLHALWDSAILRSTKRRWQSHANVLAARAVEEDVRWSPSAPRRWAEESCRLIERAGIYPARPGRIDADYIERQGPVIEHQLAVAGARLAALINAVLR